MIGALEVVDEGAGGVLPHERTTPKASTDRLDLTRATQCNLSPIWGLSLTAGLTELLGRARRAGRSVHRRDGVVHTVERVTDPQRIAAISAAVAADPVLIADGHHRYAISRTYRDEVRDGDGRTDTAAELTMTYVAELVEEQLSIDAIHRVYRGITADAACSTGWRRTSPRPKPVRVTPSVRCRGDRPRRAVPGPPDGTGVWLTPRPAAFDGVRALDGAYLEHALAESAADDRASMSATSTASTTCSTAARRSRPTPPC